MESDHRQDIHAKPRPILKIIGSTEFIEFFGNSELAVRSMGSFLLPVMRKTMIVATIVPVKIH